MAKVAVTDMLVLPAIKAALYSTQCCDLPIADDCAQATAAPADDLTAVDGDPGE